MAWTITTSSVLAAAPVTGSIVTSTHGVAISVVAVTEDGKVAASSDGHSVRLWPSLDGKHEPVVVAMRNTLALAVARDGDAVVIAGLDAIGQLELVRTSREGALLSRVDIASPRPVRAVFSTGAGLFALRDDGGIARYDLSGALAGELPPTAREHVRTLAARNAGVLALVEAGGKVHGHWIEVDEHGLHWGDETGTLPDATEAVLSPDHKRVGLVVRNKVVKLDLATGKVIERYDGDDDVSKLHVIGFADATDLAFDRSGVLGTLDGTYEPNWGDRNIAATTFAAADEMVVGGDAALLILARKREAAKFLGYQTMGRVDIVPRGTGFLASDSTSVVELGPDFRARRALELGTHSGLLQNPIFVDGDHLITAFAYGYENPQGVFLADVKTGDVSPLGSGYAFYNATTGVLVLSDNKELSISRYDRKEHEFGEPQTLPITPGAQIAWLAPTRGDFAIVTVDGNGQEEVVVDVVRVRDTPQIIKTKRVKVGDEWFRTQDVTALFDDTWTPSRSRKSPDRALVAEVRDGRMSLRDADGTERWVVPATGILDVTWTARGELVAYGDGIARVDLTTGALRERQCGWRFGLREERPMSFSGLSGTATLCEAP